MTIHTSLFVPLLDNMSRRSLIHDRRELLTDIKYRLQAAALVEPSHGLVSSNIVIRYPPSTGRVASLAGNHGRLFPYKAKVPEAKVLGFSTMAD